MTDQEGPNHAAAAAPDPQSGNRERAGRQAAILRRTARALEWSAGLAEADAERRERRGRRDEAANERAVAGRASDAARRARAQADELAPIEREPDS